MPSHVLIPGGDDPDAMPQGAYKASVTTPDDTDDLLEICDLGNMARTKDECLSGLRGC